LTNININLFTVTTPETDMGNYNVRQMNRLVSTQIESDSSLPAISRLDQNIQKKEHKYKHKEHKGTEHIVAA
jgi:hypothetical protein